MTRTPPTNKGFASGGLLSYVTDKDLKTGLSYYYDVLFKRINDNNKLFDDVGINYLDKYLVLNHGINPRLTIPKIYKSAGFEDEFIEQRCAVKMF